MYVVHVRVRKTYGSTKVLSKVRKYNVLYVYGSTFESTFVRKYFRTKVQLQLLPYGSTEELRKYFRIITSGSTFVRRYFRTKVVRTYFRTSYFRTYIATYEGTTKVHRTTYTTCVIPTTFIRTKVLSYVRRYVTSTCTYIRIQNIVVLREYGSTLFTVQYVYTYGRSTKVLPEVRRYLSSYCRTSQSGCTFTCTCTCTTKIISCTTLYYCTYQNSGGTT